MVSLHPDPLLFLGLYSFFKEGFDSRADIDLNGDVGILDLTLVATSFGKASPQEADLNELMEVSRHSPLDGAVDVGVTVRPQIFFSKRVYGDSLDANNYFATFGGEKFPATIVPADDGSFGWLFFSGAMADASHVTVTIDGSTILPVDGGLPWTPMRMACREESGVMALQRLALFPFPGPPCRESSWTPVPTGSP